MSTHSTAKRIICVMFLSLLLAACSAGDVTVGPEAATPTLIPTLAPTATVPPLPTATNAATATLEIPPSVPLVTPPTTLTLLPTNTNAPNTATLTLVPPSSTKIPIAISSNVISGTLAAKSVVVVTTQATVTTTPFPQSSVYKNQIVFSLSGDIWTIKPNSVAKTRLTTDGGNFGKSVFPDGFNRNPVWSPDGKQIAFASARDVYSEPNYDSGYELYVMRADGGGLQRTSQSSDAVNTQRLPLRWLTTGQLLVRKVTATRQQLLLFDVAEHKEYPLPIKDAQYLTYAPDKNRIAYTINRAGSDPTKNVSDLLVVGAKGGTAKNLTKDAPELNTAVTEIAWSPEGARLAYIESDNNVCGYSHLYIIGADGSGKTQLWEGGGLLSSVSWSPDGTHLLYGEALCTGETSLKLINAGGGGPQNLTEGQNPQWNTN